MKEDITLVEQTQRDILKYISQNGNAAARLPKEQEFVELLGVSRVVVREALSRLRALGIIETKRKKGTVVVVPEIFGVLKSIVASGLLDKDTLRDLYQLRLMLEIGMADFIYMNKTSEQMNQLDAVNGGEENTEGLDFVDADRLKSGCMPVQKQRFDLKKLLEDLVEAYQEAAVDRNVKFSLRLENVMIFQDQFLIERIVRNLLENALKYAHSQIKIGNDGRSFWVADDGHGISKNEQKHIFNKFYQCDTLNDIKRGSGLGLNIVYQIAQAIDAKIKFRSRSGKGTVFKIIFHSSGISC